jgi:hypothetical protein
MAPAWELEGQSAWVGSESRERESLQSVSQLRAADTGSWGWKQFGNQEGGEHLPQEAATKQHSEDCDWEHQCVW